jgi:hypothetical protein
VPREDQTAGTDNIICILRCLIRFSWRVKYSRIGQMCQKNNNFRSAYENYGTESLLVMSRVDKKDISRRIRLQEKVQPKGIGNTGSLCLYGDDNTKRHLEDNDGNHVRRAPPVFFCS